MHVGTHVDAESESGDSVVILRADPGETVGMTRDRAYFLTGFDRVDEWHDSRKINHLLATSRMWVWKTSMGCEYKHVDLQRVQ